MRRIVQKIGVTACIAVALSAFACTDVGDDVPGETADSGGSGTDATHLDSRAPSSESGANGDTGGGNQGDDATVADGASDAELAHDATLDASTPDALEDAGIADTSIADTYVPDTSVPDSNVPDSNVPDTSVIDASVADVSQPDGNVVDSAVPDAGLVDTGVVDAVAVDTGVADTGIADTGSHDTGVDAGVSPCAAYNGGAGCTPTEQRLVDKSPDCYRCMLNAGCIDDTFFGDTGHECGDVAGNAAAGAKSGSSRTSLCLATLDCIMSPAIQCASDDVNICYCGTLGSGNGCATAASGANGKCLQVEVDGLEHLASDAPSAVLPDYTDLRRGAGMANQLFVCAKANACDALCAQ